MEIRTLSHRREQNREVLLHGRSAVHWNIRDMTTDTRNTVRVFETGSHLTNDILFFVWVDAADVQVHPVGEGRCVGGVAYIGREISWALHILEVEVVEMEFIVDDLGIIPSAGCYDVALALVHWRQAVLFAIRSEVISSVKMRLTERTVFFNFSRHCGKEHRRRDGNR
jgi:hypothetical protein